ncbi:unnamed protein product [Trichobilharzia szidati]|nr:unnamed protein product [Trichobilharzia szidati]
MLLMKLNDQNEINEAQRLPDRIRKSKPVRFAFAAHEALITNNYVRFFRLARLAQCLPACLMHRYFVQIRGQALTRLSYAFAGHPKREVHYPISTLTRQLGFENNTETKDFCERWGLTTDDSNVIFEKQVQPEPPELPWRENRSFQIIENKRIGTTLSELFNGSPINPSDAIPPPVKSSFDTNGMYIAGGQNTNVQTVTSNNDTTTTTNNNMVVSSSSGFGNVLFSNRITADDGSSNNRDSNIINSTVNYSLSSTPLFPLFQQAKLNSSLITSQPSSSWLTGANTQNKKPIIDNQLVEQIFYECVVDDVMHFKELAENLLLQEMIIHEWIENLLEMLIKEQLTEIFNKAIHPVNEMSKVLIESLINELINDELYHIVQFEFILESLCHEIFDQLIKERLCKLTSSSLTKSLATSLYNAALIKYCVNRFRYLIWKREEAKQDEILLNRMSTSVGADCLPLRLMPINYHDYYYCNTKAANVSVDQSQANINLSDAIDSQKTVGIFPVRNALHNHHLMNSRFSPEISKVDDALTWSALKPSSIFCKYPLGIYTSILLPPYGCSETVQKQLKNTVYWIYRKFKDFPLILLDKWPDSSMSGKLSALIVIGQFNHPITREQLVLSMQPLDSSDVPLSNSSSQYQPVDDHLLILAITIATQAPLSLSSENLKNLLNDNDGICVLQLTNHISLGSSGKFLPNPYWSINLQYSLQWLEECFSRMLNRSPVVGGRSWNHRRKFQINNVSNNNGNHHIYSTVSLASLSASTSTSTVPAEVTVYTELSDLVDQYIDACFLRPLADLSAFWKSQNFVDPSMKSLLDAYHTMLSRLFVQLLPTNKELTNLLHNTLMLPNKIINLICIDDLEETETKSKNPSNLALKSPPSSSASASSSSSWSILVQNWTTLSKELNFSLSTECWLNTSIRKVEQNFELHLNKVFSSSPLVCKSSSSPSIANSVRKVLPSVYLAPNLNLFFALIRNCLNNLFNALLNNCKVKSNIELDKVIEFSNVICKLIDQIEPESILNDMTEYFKNIDEPCMKQVNAINLSIDNSRYNDIKKCLYITKPSSSTSMSASASNVEQEESLSVRLDKLCLKIQQVENSMTEALNETTQSSIQ